MQIPVAKDSMAYSAGHNRTAADCRTGTGGN